MQGRIPKYKTLTPKPRKIYTQATSPTKETVTTPLPVPKTTPSTKKAMSIPKIIPSLTTTKTGVVINSETGEHFDRLVANLYHYTQGNPTRGAHPFNAILGERLQDFETCIRTELSVLCEILDTINNIQEIFNVTIHQASLSDNYSVVPSQSISNSLVVTNWNTCQVHEQPLDQCSPPTPARVVHQLDLLRLL